MFMRKGKRKGQTTAEYAVLIGLVIAAVIAMQVYVKRGLQSKIAQETDGLTGGFSQYEPYYLSSDFQSSRDTRETETTATGGGVTRVLGQDASSRTGVQRYEGP